MEKIYGVRRTATGFSRNPITYTDLTEAILSAIKLAKKTNCYETYVEELKFKDTDGFPYGPVKVVVNYQKRTGELRLGTYG